MTQADLDTWDTSTVPSDYTGFNQLVGLHVTAWTHGCARVELLAQEQHLNRLGILNGGVVATLLDTVMGMAVSYDGPDKPRRRGVTLTLNAQFLQAARPGLLIAQSRQVGGGAKTFFMEADVRDTAGDVLMTGQGTFKLLR